MATEKELTKLREKLSALPNPFDWSKYSKKCAKQREDHIMENPYECDECGEIYNKGDLFNNFPKHLICRNCIDEYGRK